MPENGFERKHPLQCEDIMRNVNMITDVAVSAGIPIEQFLNIGGIPVMLHTCASSRHSLYALNWRGTVDIDVAVTTRTGANTFFEALADRGVNVLTHRPSKTIPHKFALEIGLDTARGYFPSGRKLEVDVYSPDDKGITWLNNRQIHAYPGTVVSHPAEVHHCWGHAYTVPHVIDTLILKTDVLQATTRKKDVIDISSLFFSAERYGIEPKQLIDELKQAHSANSSGTLWAYWSSRLAPELLKIVLDQTLSKYDFIPTASQEYRHKLAKLLRLQLHH